MGQTPVRPKMPVDVVDDFVRLGDVEPPADDFVLLAPAAQSPAGQPLESTSQPPEQREDGLLMRGAKATGQGAINLGIGIAKGAANTAIGAGQLVQQVPGVTKATDWMYGLPPGASAGAMTEAKEAVQPEGAMQNVGFYGEQIGEAFIPGTKVGTLSNAVRVGVQQAGAKAVGKTAANLAVRGVEEAGIAGAHAAVQGGDPEAAAMFGAAAPVVGKVAGKVAPIVASKLSKTAEKLTHQALGPTKERFKAMAEKIVPEIIKRRLGAGKSRETLLQEAFDQAEKVSQDIDAALQKWGSKRIDSKTVTDTLENAKNAFRQKRTMPIAQALREGLITASNAKASGSAVRYVLKPNQRILPNGTLEHIVELDGRPLRKLEKLQKVVAELGPDPTVDQLVGVRRAWDSIVDGVGGYAHRASGGIGVPLKEQSEAWAKMKGAQAIRKLLAAEVPDLAAVNKEYHFWAQLRDVLSQTEKRTAPQEGNLLARITRGIGTLVGGAGGMAYGGGPEGLAGAYAVGKLAEMTHKVVTSPNWRFASAQMRDRLAKAIINNDASEIAMTLARIAAVQSSRERTERGEGIGPGPSAPATGGRAGGAGPGGQNDFVPIGDFEVREVQ